MIQHPRTQSEMTNEDLILLAVYARGDAGFDHREIGVLSPLVEKGLIRRPQQVGQRYVVIATQEGHARVASFCRMVLQPEPISWEDVTVYKPGKQSDPNSWSVVFGNLWRLTVTCSHVSGKWVARVSELNHDGHVLGPVDEMTPREALNAARLWIQGLMFKTAVYAAAISKDLP